MKHYLLFSVLIILLTSIKVNSQNSYFRNNQSVSVTNSIIQRSSGSLFCRNCQRSLGTETSGSSDDTGNSNGNTIGDIIKDNASSIYEDIVDSAKDKATSTWNSLSSGAKAGIIIAVIVVAIIIIAGIIHCLCICKLCCCC